MARTLMTDTELTSKSCSGWETAGSGESHERVSKLLQAEQRLLCPSAQLLDDPGWK